MKIKKELDANVANHGLGFQEDGQRCFIIIIYLFHVCQGTVTLIILKSVLYEHCTVPQMEVLLYLYGQLKFNIYVYF